VDGGSGSASGVLDGRPRSGDPPWTGAGVEVAVLSGGGADAGGDETHPAVASASATGSASARDRVVRRRVDMETLLGWSDVTCSVPAW
jgi:hypothetical protein